MSETIDDSGPAYPFVSHGGLHEHQCCDPGMTLRDAFAIAAVQSVSLGVIVESEGVTAYESLASGAYRLADAMLAARKAKP